MLERLIAAIPKPLMKRLYFSRSGGLLLKVYGTLAGAKKVHKLPSGAMMYFSMKQPGEIAQYLDYFELEIVEAFLSSVKRGSVVFDVGAFHGYYAMLALGAGASRIVALDIDDHQIEHIKENVRLNNAEKVVIVLKQGVSNVAGNGSTTHHDNASMRQLQVGSGDLPVDTIDNTAAALGISAIDMLIMDIEGGEALAVEGMQGLLETGKIKDVIIEMHPALMERYNRLPDDVFAQITRHGYTIKKMQNENPNTFHAHFRRA